MTDFLEWLTENMARLKASEYRAVARALERLIPPLRMSLDRQIRMGQDGPREGDVNDAGLVFHNHRWRRKDDVSVEPKGKLLRLNPVAAVSVLRKAGLQSSKLSKRERRSGFNVSQIHGKPALMIQWHDHGGTDDNYEARSKQMETALTDAGFEVSRPFPDKTILGVVKREKAAETQSEPEKSTPVAKWAAKRFKDPSHAKAFVEWFGDSKVVDENGEPLVVYHGTKGDEFNEFKEIGYSRERWGNRGHYFTADPEYASGYATQGATEQSRLVPVMLALKNPKILRDRETSLITTKQMEQFQSDGHDGVIGISRLGEKIEFVAFDAKQIKSATGNRGTFDPDDPKITMSREAVEWRP